MNIVTLENAPAHAIWTGNNGEKRLRATETHNNDTTKEVFETGMVDEKGRKVSYRVTRRSIVYTIPAEGENYGRLIKHGETYGIRYCAHIQKCKDGYAFGASQHAQEFITEGAREAYIAKALKTRLK